MSAHFAGWDRRTLDLALDEVTLGLSEEERAELRSRAGAHELEALEHAVAELNLAGLGELEAAPAELMRRISADASAHFDFETAAPVARPVGARARRFSLWSAAGWVAAAVVLACFVLDRSGAWTRAPADLRERLLASAAGLVRAPWTPTADPLAGALSGDVVWSSERQEGYMRFRSLAPNDPERNQYQLWVFDSTRSDWEAQPVDGGVFDVGPGEEVVVPVDAKLEVRKAALFALTLEAPGGVVVSSRQHLLATASPDPPAEQSGSRPR